MGELCVLVSSRMKFLNTVGVMLNSPKLNVGSTLKIENWYGSQQNRSISTNCCSVARTAIGSGAHTTSWTNRSSFSAFLHYSITTYSMSCIPLVECGDNPCPTESIISFCCSFFFK